MSKASLVNYKESPYPYPAKIWVLLQTMQGLCLPFNLSHIFDKNDCSIWKVIQSFVFHIQRSLVEEEEYRVMVASGSYNKFVSQEQKKKKIKKSDYFSDEEEVSDWRKHHMTECVLSLKERFHAEIPVRAMKAALVSCGYKSCPGAFVGLSENLEGLRWHMLWTRG